MPTSTSPQNLWAAAVTSLNPEDQTRLTSIPTDNQVALLEGLMSLVKAKQQHCMEKRWKYKRRSGEVIILRDVMEKTSKWLQKFREVGDVAVQYDPSHATLAWAAVRFLLQISINDVETFGAATQGIESTARLISRCAVYEATNLRSAGSAITALQSIFKDELVCLYAAILTYLSKAGAYYKRRTAEEFWKALFCHQVAQIRRSKRY